MSENGKNNNNKEKNVNNDNINNDKGSNLENNENIIVNEIHENQDLNLNPAPINNNVININIIDNIPNNNNIINNNINNNNIDLITEGDDENTINIIKTKIKFLREKYNFSLQYHEIIQKIMKYYTDLTFNKLNNSIKEILNYVTFFKESTEAYANFAKQIKVSNNIIMSIKKGDKIDDNILLESMQNTQNKVFQNINNMSNNIKQNILNKKSLSALNEKIYKIENLKKENIEKFNTINEVKNNLQKSFNKYEELFDSYLPSPNLIINSDKNKKVNNSINLYSKPERPSLIDTPDFILIVQSLLLSINKLIVDINLYVISIKDTFYKINELYKEISDLIKKYFIVYIKEFKNLFNNDLAKSLNDIEEYYKKLDDKTLDQIFKLNQIFNTKESEDYIYDLLQQYYILLSNSNSVKKEHLTDVNNFSIKNKSNIFIFFEWFISVSPQPTDISKQNLIIKKINIKRDPGIFFSWKDSILIFTKQKHLLLFDKPGYYENLVKIFEFDKISLRKDTKSQNKFLFEIIVERKGKIMDFKGTFLFDAINQENIELIFNLIHKH